VREVELDAGSGAQYTCRKMPGHEEFGSAVNSRRWGGPRPGSLAFSLLLHSAVAFLLLWFSNGYPGETPILHEQMTEPHYERMVWYHLKEIPRISPETSSETDRITAEKFNRDVIIHQAPEAAHDDRLVWRTPDLKAPQQKTPAANMIAVQRGGETTSKPNQEAVENSAAEPPKADPKPFVAPAAPPPAAAARIRIEEPPFPEPPKLAIPDAGLSALAAANKVRYSRRFVPPAPAVKATPGDTAGVNLPPDAPTLPGSGGASDINALVINTVRAGAIDAAPPRQSAISVGPVTGIPSDGGGRGGMQIAGVTVIPGAATPETAEASLKSPKDPFTRPTGSSPAPTPYVTTRVAPLEHTLSAPLPPSSRNIPRSIETRFRGRIVYTMLLPMKGLPGYTGDWIIWFAEREHVEGGGAGAPMRAPLPIRKPIRAEFVVPDLSPGVIQLSASMDKAGRIGAVAVIGGSGTIAEGAIEDLESWEFLPALRNREAVDIDLIVEIPFGINQKVTSPAVRVPVLGGVDRTSPTPHN
jgi:hypothetical protein